jgi:integrative and conjugative element protein (TIGR02256 family)
MIRECIAYPDTETGGILIGKKIDDSKFVVVFAIGSGPKATRSRTRFAPDISWQQHILEKLFERYAVNYLGSYHRHPGFCYEPSFLDRRNAKEITSNPDWNVCEAIFPIIIFHQNGIEVYLYYFSRESDNFQPVSCQVISNNDSLINTVLQRGKE